MCNWYFHVSLAFCKYLLGGSIIIPLSLVLSHSSIACWEKQLPSRWANPSTKDLAHWKIILLITAWKEYNPICLSQNIHYSKLVLLLFSFLLVCFYGAFRNLVSLMFDTFPFSTPQPLCDFCRVNRCIILSYETIENTFLFFSGVIT